MIHYKNKTWITFPFGQTEYIHIVRGSFMIIIKIIPTTPLHKIWLFYSFVGTVSASS